MKMFWLFIWPIAFMPSVLLAQESIAVPCTPTCSPTNTPVVETITEKTPLGQEVKALYDSLDLSKAGLSYRVFRTTLIGYYNIRPLFSIKKTIVSIIDLDKPSTEERLWVIDLEKKVLLKKSLVAHGKQSGENFAIKFSNDVHSSASSLGFYITKGTYQGKNGFSLKLEGIDDGFNTNAMKRAVVMHGANYVSYQFAKTYGRLGRSWGCPAVPFELVKEIIDEISHGSVMFINKTGVGYVSKYMDEEKASSNFSGKI